jgi:phosphatidate cytidylyltransferase
LKELLTRALSGLLFAAILIGSLQFKYACIALFFLFGLVCLAEFNKLIHQKNIASYIIFIVLFVSVAFWEYLFSSSDSLSDISQILLVVCVFVNLLLVRDLFSKKSLPTLLSNHFINTTFYVSSGFVFLLLIALNFENYSAQIIMYIFILIWINDTFAYIIGKNFGKQKLFESISPKKTVEGFLGGVFFAALASYVIANYTNIMLFTNWLIISVIVSVFGTLGDLVESKYKRQAAVKDSGTIMPGHGGLLDRLDSAIFAAPFIYLFLRILNYVS